MTKPPKLQASTTRLSTVDQTFSFNAPEATSVLLVGDFTHWQRKPVPLRKEADGIWRATVPLGPGQHHYRLIVDSEWRDDAECALRVPNPFGSQNSVAQAALPA